MRKKLISLEVSCDEMCDLMLLKQELKHGAVTQGTFHDRNGNPYTGLVVEKNRDSERQLELVEKLIKSAK